MNFHQRIKQARINKGLTLQELGDMCGITAQSVRQWEIDGMPRANKIAKIAQILGVSSAWLQFGDDNPTEQEFSVIQEYYYSFPILDDKVKNQAFEIIKQYGMNPEQVFNLILHEIAATKKIPLHFDYLHLESE